MRSITITVLSPCTAFSAPPKLGLADALAMVIDTNSDVRVEAGAHIGMFDETAKREPDPEHINVEHLQESVQHEGVSEWISI